MHRTEALRIFYQSLSDVEKKLGGPSPLAGLKPRDVPLKGVCFFFERGEKRSDTGCGPRVVRVGTHGLIQTSRTTLWNRLSAHRGVKATGGGNHRGSIFRLLLGNAMLVQQQLLCSSWGIGNTAQRQVRDSEKDLKRLVSVYVGAMTIIWREISSREGRMEFEREAIALLSNYHRDPVDPPSSVWLGNYSSRDKVRSSGLWNCNHVDEEWSERIFNLI